MTASLLRQYHNIICHTDNAIRYKNLKYKCLILARESLLKQFRSFIQNSLYNTGKSEHALRKYQLYVIWKQWSFIPSHLLSYKKFPLNTVALL